MPKEAERCKKYPRAIDVVDTSWHDCIGYIANGGHRLRRKLSWPRSLWTICCLTQCYSQSFEAILPANYESDTSPSHFLYALFQIILINVSPTLPTLGCWQHSHLATTLRQDHCVRTVGLQLVPPNISPRLAEETHQKNHHKSQTQHCELWGTCNVNMNRQGPSIS